MSEYVYKNGKKLRCGYTTGTCAAAAAQCAARMLLGLSEDLCAFVRTPSGTCLELPVSLIDRTDSAVCCAVRKDAGDDEDVTDGLMILARVELAG